MGNFKDLRVWQDGIKLASNIYHITKKESFAKDYGLANQIQRATVSIASNIAEGEERRTKKETVHFLSIAQGSSAEVITQLHIAYNISYIDKATFEKLEDQTEKIRASIKNLIKVKGGHNIIK